MDSQANEKAAQLPTAEKKKKVRAPPPSAPPVVFAAGAVIRGAMAAVLGQKFGGVFGALQPTWVAEPGTAKISMSLKGVSAKIGFGIPEEDQHVIDAVKAAVDDLIQRDLPIQRFEMPRTLAETVVGMSVADANAKKGMELGSGDTVELVYIPGVVALVNLARIPLPKTTGIVQGISFQSGGKNAKKATCVIVAGKKADLNIKFSVVNGGEGGGGDSEVLFLGEDHPSLHEIVGAIKTLDTQEATLPPFVKEETVPPTSGAVGGGGGAAEEGGSEESEAMVVNVNSVTGKIDYDKLINEFGSQLITPELVARIEALTVGKGRVKALHPWLRRGIFFSHRDLIAICEAVERRDNGSDPEAIPFYLYTGRGPSSGSMHLGHLVPFMFTQWLQKAFDVPLVIQMTDDEKFLWKGKYVDGKGDNLMDFKGLTVENSKDIIACGFNKQKTFIFSDLDYVGEMYPNIVRIWKAVSYNQAKGAFGFDGSSNIGQVAYSAIQAAPSFPSSFPRLLGDTPLLPCLIPCAIDQDPYFRLTRDIAHKLVPPAHPLKGKPALIHSKFFPPLQGAKGKMSSSDANSAIFLTDTPDEISKKIKEHAFSGGQDTSKLQRELGADLVEDVSYQWLSFFLDDDEELASIGKDYSTGTGVYWATGKVKERLITLLQAIVAEHQKHRIEITNDEVAEWMQVRRLC